MIVGQGPIALAVGAVGGCLDIFTYLYPFSHLSPSLWETARYRRKYCLKGPLNPKQPTNQPTNTSLCLSSGFIYTTLVVCIVCVGTTPYNLRHHNALYWRSHAPLHCRVFDNPTVNLVVFQVFKKRTGALTGHSYYLRMSFRFAFTFHLKLW